MNTRMTLAAAMAFSAAAVAADMNTVKAIDVRATQNGAEVVLRGSHPPTFSVFRLNDPDRLVIDLANTSTAEVKGHHDGAGPAVGIVASQFSNARSEVGRVLIGLEGLERYDVRPRENDLVISLEGASQVRPAPVAEVAPEVAAGPELAGAAAESAVAQPPSIDSDVLDTRLDEIAVAKPAHVLKGVRWSNRTLRLSTDGPVAKFELTTLQNPPRLAIDLFGMRSSARAPKVSDALVREVRLGASEGKVRVVVEGRDAMPSFSTARIPKGLDVTFGSPLPDAASEVSVAEIDGTRLVGEERSVEVKGVSFKESPAGGSVDIKVAKGVRWRVERPDASSAVLVLENATIAKTLERSLDTSALSTPVKMVSAFAVPGTQRRVRVVVGASASFQQAVTRTADGLRWDLEQSDVEDSKLTSNQTAGFSTEAAEFADEAAPQQRRYVGKRVSFEFKDIDIHNLLRIIAEISKKNLIVSDDVGGRVTIRLRNVPWDQVLDLVMKARGLGKQEYGNIMRVAPMSVFEAEAKAAEAIRESRMKSSPLAVQLIPVNYATATDVSSRVKEILSPRGNVTVDSRTNTLIVRDVADNMGKVKSLVAVLDTQTPQVLIESRIVEASTTFSREIGIQWGGNALMSAATGNPTGLVFPNSVALIGGVTGNSAGTVSSPNYAISLPVGAGDGRGGAVGLTFGSAGGAVQLNMRLSALEAQGAVRTVSAPRVTTLDNMAARISQGVSIPFSQVSAAGANTAFVEAALSLSVTPHITMDGSVTLNINAQNNSPDPAATGSNGQPGIARKEAATNVLVKDGDTTVIGGIYTRTGSSNQAGLPILSKIPVIGFFFRNYRELEAKQELLIFVSPRILNRQAVAQTL